MWREVMAQSAGKVTHDPFTEPEAVFTEDFAYLRFGSMCLNKARRLGWTGFVDTLEAIFEMYREMEQLGMLPGMQAESAISLCYDKIHGRRRRLRDALVSPSEIVHINHTRGEMFYRKHKQNKKPLTFTFYAHS